MTEWMTEILERYGQEVTVESGGEETAIRGFLQPMTERSETEAETVTGIGRVDLRRWLYLGRTALGMEDTVVWNGLRLRVRSCRPYHVGGELSHYWAALEEAREVG